MIVLAEQSVLAARPGDRVALTRVVEACSGPVFNLAYRMLGHRADAEDATQEILIKVVTHLGSIREPGAAGGWVLRVAFHHMIHERRRGVLESQQLTFSAFAEDLETGLAPIDDAGLTEPEQELAIRQVKEGCTLAMLCCLSRALRATYILGEVFEVSDADGAALVGVAAATCRHRLKPAWRAAKKPWMEAIIEMLLTSQGTCNGFLQAQVSSKAVEGKYRARQQIEQSITENALVGLRESVFRGIDPGHSDMTRDVLVESLYGFISDMAFLPGAGPWRYTGVGPKDVSLPIWCSRAQMPADAVTTGDIETFQDWSSFAYGFELTGDPIFLDKALEQFPGTLDLYQRLRNDGTNNIENRSPLLALLQRRAGIP